MADKAAKHKAIIHWEKHQDGNESYSWSFDSGVVIHNASQATIAQQGMVDPESAFVASVASCQMLSLLAAAAKQGFVVSQYHDEAVGVLEVNAENRIAVTRILLQPQILFTGADTPNDSQLAELLETASRNCFIANSIKTQVQVEATVLETEITEPHPN